MKLGERGVVEIDTIPSGSLSLDIALGIGGLPKEELLKFMVQKVQVKQHYHSTLLLRPKKMAEHALL